MTANMRTVQLSRRSRTRILHVEAPGCIVNIHVGLTNAAGLPVTRIDVKCDDYAGEPAWQAFTGHNRKGAAVIVRTIGETPDDLDTHDSATADELRARIAEYIARPAVQRGDLTGLIASLADRLNGEES